MNYLTVPLRSSHNKKDFSCGKQSLDKHIQEQASQDVKRKLSACFILEDENDIVKGYYTLSGSSIRKELVPEGVSKKMPNAYQDLPVTLLGRLAVDARYKGQKLGELLLDALNRSCDNARIIGSIAVVVDPLDENAEAFYKRYGFILLPDSKKMFLSMKTIEKLLK
ncbi:GNAT family N-acetyltransferase [Chitinophaga cymbidii]|uniref:N-acetyltransferase n=1 Tax=Chitinophaga cymbidii TaxID=1096750 RepID=A0A512RJ62_9BACT|nr:GNAT family N-acetyltransferase [Chitinophaga cymbidii]GEP95749.1 N-acetyltransferase [Chitinophaga cymbidii]